VNDIGRLGEFTLEEYRVILRTLRKHYKACRFPEAEENLKRDVPFVLLRHDIDMDLPGALELAQIEADVGFLATYFVLLRTEHYSIFSDLGRSIIFEILSLGHAIGLHFDCACYPDRTPSELREDFVRERTILETWLGRSVEVVSHHRPSKAVLEGTVGLGNDICDTYQPIYTQKITYLSDSRGCWRFGHPLRSEAFRRNDPLHILTHPVWWNTTPTQARDSLNMWLDRTMKALQNSLQKNCEVYRDTALTLDSGR